MGSTLNANGFGYNKGYLTSVAHRKRVTGADYNLSGDNLSYTYEYQKELFSNLDYPDNRFRKTALAGKFESICTYDSLGRSTGRIFNRIGVGTMFAETYKYKDAVDANGTKTGTTGYVSSASCLGNGPTDYYSYSYDRNGNITQIAGLQDAVTYTYDGLNRLTSETAGGNTTEWAYDTGGNITNKKVKNSSGAVISNIVYEYGQNGWKDRLTNRKTYDGGGSLLSEESVTYDNCGNPVFYMGANLLTWTRGRTLESYENNYIMCNYAYNAGGYRVSKTVQTKGGNTVTHKYWLEGSRILKETRIGGSTNETLLYYYDATGVCGMNYNGTDYYYRKNIQGDITHILDTSGNVVARYVYERMGLLHHHREHWKYSRGEPVQVPRILLGRRDGLVLPEQPVLRSRSGQVYFAGQHRIHGAA